MANNFISNSAQKTLSGRLNKIIEFSESLSWLVGFFYFSGWREVCEKLKENPDINIRLLVGLQVEKDVKGIYERAVLETDLSRDEQFENFIDSLNCAINNKEQDTKELYNQIGFFLQMIKENRLIIRKTKEPNHAKLYLFQMNSKEQQKHEIDGYFITGSSNLTHSGLRGQQEFNVEIKDYGYNSALEYFSGLWDSAIEITEIEEQKTRLVEFIEHRSITATVTPYEAYAFILKTYIELQTQKKLKPKVEQLLEKNGYKKYRYQLDAVNQALEIIAQYNGVIIADVVGLGKSIISSMVAKNLNTKGIIICPPGLVGDHKDKTGWWGYVRNFELDGWHVYSRGAIEELEKKLDDSDIDTVIIDEAHNFRNQDTKNYENLQRLCRGKQVILLTATPFNNTPADIFSLLKLFLIPGRSPLTLDDNLDGIFRSYNYRFKKLFDILKNYNSKNEKKRQKAENDYVKILGKKLPVDINIVREETAQLAATVKNVIEPITIRRNRIDLKEDYQYSKEIDSLSTIDPPTELFFYLSESQSKFYDSIIETYFNEEGIFTGAIYQPANYEKKVDEDELDEEGNRVYYQQRNLFEFMRRLLIKRFESSFGAFEKTIERFIKVHKIVLEFIESSGKYILDRNLIEKIYQADEEEVLGALENYEKEITDKGKENKVYKVNSFELKKEFLSDIKKDLALFESIKEQIKQEQLVDKDPKREDICKEVEKSLEQDSKRKIIIFTEYVDTVKHLEKYFKKKLSTKVLTCDGSLTKSLSESLEANFNAQYNGISADDYQVLITSDKLSEGVNLNRAGTIINYDIPYNPTRVIQRVGRINRIGEKVFNNLYIFNFFPSEKGAEYVKSKEIAQQKMFMIHSALGEDAQIFSEDENPTASGLYKKINQTLENNEQVNFITEIRNKYNQIEKKYPEVIQRIEKLPTRVKSAKKANEYNVNVLRKKGLSFFPQQSTGEQDTKVENLDFKNFLEFIECEYDTKRQELSDNFWDIYEKIKHYKESSNKGFASQSKEAKAHDNLQVALKVIAQSEEENIQFIKTLIEDIKEYRTMPTYTLGRLAFDSLNQKSSKKKWDSFFSELENIKNRFGKDYLEKIKKQDNKKEDEIIIAVENQT